MLGPVQLGGDGVLGNAIKTLTDHLTGLLPFRCSDLAVSDDHMNAVFAWRSGGMGTAEKADNECAHILFLHGANRIDCVAKLLECVKQVIFLLRDAADAQGGFGDYPQCAAGSDKYACEIWTVCTAFNGNIAIGVIGC